MRLAMMKRSALLLPGSVRASCATARRFWKESNMRRMRSRDCIAARIWGSGWFALGTRTTADAESAEEKKRERREDNSEKRIQSKTAVTEQRTSAIVSLPFKG